MRVEIWKLRDNLVYQIVVYDVLEVNRLELISPWMEDSEALVLDVLVSEPLDVLTDKLIVSLIGLDGVDEFVGVHFLFLVLDKGRHGLEAR